MHLSDSDEKFNEHLLFQSLEGFNDRIELISDQMTIINTP
jgi:hypothetical protein